MFPGVPKSMLTLWPDLRSNSGTRLVITARAPPVEMTLISAASTWVARAQTKLTIAPARFIPTLLCRQAEGFPTHDPLMAKQDYHEKIKFDRIAVLQASSLPKQNVIASFLEGGIY